MADIPLSGLESMMQRMSSRVPDLLREGILEATAHAVEVIQEVLFDRVESGTGTLAASFKPHIVDNAPKDEIWTKASSDLSYAKIQDEGGTIRPKNVKNLTIPFPGSSIKQGHTARTDFKQLSLIVSKKGNLLFVRYTGAKKKVVVKGRTRTIKEFKPEWILKKSVTIPAKRYMQEATVKATPGIFEIMGDHVKMVDEVQ